MAIEAVAAKAAKAHTRYYLPDGTEVPGVTTVLGVLAKPALIHWANKLGLEGIEVSKYVDKLAVIGTLAHHMIECHLTGEEPDLSAYSPEEIDKAENALISFFEWAKQHSIKPVFCERQLVSEQYGYGGTIDCYALVDGIPTLLDFKTSRAIYDEHIIQAAAYRQLLSEHSYEVQEVRILQIGRDETEGFTERVVADTVAHWEIFRHALEIYKLQRQIRKGV